MLLVACLAIFSSGCGSNGGGIDDWIKPQTIVYTSNISGQVLYPAIGASSILPGILSSTGASGAYVFVEELPAYSAFTDSGGNFTIKNVPVGSYRVIAELNNGTISYKQRSTIVSITGQYGTIKITDPMQLVTATKSLNMLVRQVPSGDVVIGAALVLWGHTYTTLSSDPITLGPVPAGAWPVRVQATGYYESNMLLNFQDDRQDLLEVGLVPLTAVQRNQSPVVEIYKDFKTLYTFASGNLQTSAFDGDGDPVTVTWTASPGLSLAAAKGSSNVVTASGTVGTFTIEAVATDGKGGSGRSTMKIGVIQGGTGPVDPNNHRPNAPYSPFPANTAGNVTLEVTLSWLATDSDGNALKYDVWLGPAAGQMKLVASNLDTPYYRATSLASFSTYLWKIVVRDTAGAENEESPIWQFTTGDGSSHAPYTPYNPNPPDLGTDQLTSILLTWKGGSPNGTVNLTYQLYFGTDASALTLATATTKTSSEMTGLQVGTRYFWRVLSIDPSGGIASGPTWQFTTYSVVNRPPNSPRAANPTHGATGVALKPLLWWVDEDPDGDRLYFDLYFGKTGALQKIAENLSSATFQLSSDLRPFTEYTWQVVARDPDGRTNENPAIFTFTTGKNANNPPTVPQAVSPVNNQTSIALQPVLSWTGGDPDGDAVVYDVYFSAASPPVDLVGSGLKTPYFSILTQLTQGQFYWWKIVARDEWGIESTSPVYTFSTVSGVDSVPPKVVGIVPANDSTGIDQSAQIEVTFSEPMDQISVENNFVFNPDFIKTITWKTPCVVAFTPENPWNLGHFQIVTNAGGTCRDLTGNILDAGTRVKFSVKTEIPLPSGFHSAGFGIDGGVGGDIGVSLENMAPASVLQGIVVAGAATSSAVVTPRISADGAGLEGFAKTPEAAFRSINARFSREPQANAGTSIEPAILAAAADAYTLGAVKTFYIPSYGKIATTTDFPANKIQAVCVGLTGSSAVFVDTAIGTPDYSIVGEFRRRLEDVILPILRDAYGSEPPVGADGSSRMTLLLTNSLSEGVEGVFSAADLSGNNPNDPQLRESNARKMLYIRYTVSEPMYTYSSLAHQFAHMAVFWQKRIAGAGTEETWLDEGMAAYAETLCGFGLDEGNQRSAQGLLTMENNLSKLSLTNWNHSGNSMLSYLFVRFLAENGRYRTTSREATRALCRSAKTGIESVATLTGESFENTLGRFFLGMLLNRHASTVEGDYGFKGLDLGGTFGATTMPGIPITTVPDAVLYPDIPARGCIFLKRVTSGGKVSMRIYNLTNPARGWFLDTRN